jgi:hypothetical protein
MAYSKPPKRTAKEWAAFKHWLENPVDAVKDWFKITPDDWQGDALNAVFTGGTDRVAIKSAHGPGKSALDSWIGWIFLQCYEDSRVVAVAPTAAQLSDALFPEYAKWHGRMPEKMQNEWVLSSTHIRHKGKPNVWFAVGRTSNRPENVQGFHGTHILVQGDEASGIPENVFEVIEGILTEAGEEGRVAKLVIDGNPNFTAGELFHAFNKNKELYHRITVTGDTSLLGGLGIEQGGYHEKHGLVYYSPRVRKKYVDNMAKKYGLSSAVFDVRVRGVFPSMDDECVIPYEWAARAMLLPMKKDEDFDRFAVPARLVVDVARGGGGENVVGRFRGDYITKLTAEKPGAASTTPCVNLCTEQAGALAREGIRFTGFKIDEPGVGGGVIDALRRLDFPVVPYNGGVTMKTDIDPADDCRMFFNQRARDWWALRRKLEHGNYPLPQDEVLLGQLTSIKYYFRNEKIVIESKEDLKDRLGKDASPDRGDVVVMGNAETHTAAETHGKLSVTDVISGKTRPRYQDPDEIGREEPPDSEEVVF